MVLKLGVVSFLNARPLIAGLAEDARVQCVLDVPAALPNRLDRAEVDVALIPVIDVLRAGGRYQVVSDACIACDGETMTVRVFSQVPPDRMDTLWVDPDSHTSVALARILWRDLFERDLALRAWPVERKNISELRSVLLIGDKVVDPRRGSFAYEVDLGGAWRQLTGLPFVFAVWASLTTRNVATGVADVSALLSRARDHGVARAAEIAAEYGPALGWPVELARRYLTRCLKYTLDARCTDAAQYFATRCAALGLVPGGATIDWPEHLLEGRYV